MKKFLAALLALALCLTLFACGEEKTTEPTQAPAAATPTEAPSEPTAEPTPAPKTFLDYLMEGYDMPIEDFMCSSPDNGTVIAIKDIPEEEAKQALLSNGHKETDFVICAHGNLGEITSDFTDDEMYEPQYKYVVTVESYSTAASAGGYMIALDQTAGNHAFASNVFQPGYMKKSFDWIVGVNGEYALDFFNVPETVYIAGFSLLLDYDPYREDVYVTDLTYKDITAEDLAKGYTFTFAKDNVPDLGPDPNYVNIAKIPAEAETYKTLRESLTAANGFSSDYAFRSENGTVPLYCLRDLVSKGHKYTITIRFLADNAMEEGSYFAHLLPMENVDAYSTNGHQAQSGFENQVNFTPKAVEGLTNVYDMTGSIDVTSETTNMVTAYCNKSNPGYVASITIVETAL